MHAFLPPKLDCYSNTCLPAKNPILKKKGLKRYFTLTNNAKQTVNKGIYNIQSVKKIKL
jgi:hypothetical protein